MTDKIEVTQADRDAAADHGYNDLIWHSRIVNAVRKGYEDDCALVQAFARHRLAHSTPADQEPVVWPKYTQQRIAEVVEEGDGFWKPCSGCQESCDGCVSTDDYPYSDTFKCQPGSGCGECGGIGVIWDDTDYEQMAAFMLEEKAAPPASPDFNAGLEEAAKACENIYDGGEACGDWPAPEECAAAIRALRTEPPAQEGE